MRFYTLKGKKYGRGCLFAPPPPPPPSWIGLIKPLWPYFHFAIFSRSAFPFHFKLCKYLTHSNYFQKKSKWNPKSRNFFDDVIIFYSWNHISVSHHISVNHYSHDVKWVTRTSTNLIYITLPSNVIFSLKYCNAA